MIVVVVTVIAGLSTQIHGPCAMGTLESTAMRWLDLVVVVVVDGGLVVVVVVVVVVVWFVSLWPMNPLTYGAGHSTIAIIINIIGPG